MPGTFLGVVLSAFIASWHPNIEGIFSREGGGGIYPDIILINEVNRINGSS